MLLLRFFLARWVIVALTCCTIEVLTCWTVVEALTCLDIVGLEVGSMEGLGRPPRPLEKTEKKGLAQGIVAEITLTWQASSDITCNRTASAAGFALKTLACRGWSRHALGAIRSKRRPKAMTTLAFVLKGIWMLQTRWIAPASKASSRIQEQTAVASLWRHWRALVGSQVGLSLIVYFWTTHSVIAGVLWRSVPGVGILTFRQVSMVCQMQKVKSWKS